jgi:hypothetical protein
LYGSPAARVGLLREMELQRLGPPYNNEQTRANQTQAGRQQLEDRSTRELKDKRQLQRGGKEGFKRKRKAKREPRRRGRRAARVLVGFGWPGRRAAGLITGWVCEPWGASAARQRGCCERRLALHLAQMLVLSSPCSPLLCTPQVTWLQFWGMHDFHPSWGHIFHNRIPCFVAGRVSASQGGRILDLARRASWLWDVQMSSCRRSHLQKM